MLIASNKDRIRAMLKSLETGDSAAVSVVNEAKYIQHNPQTHEGSEGLAVLFKRLSETSTRVNIVRAFEDGDYVFAHTEYDFSRRNIGFEIFRFEDGFAVEHWDNIQKREAPNESGQSMVGGEVVSSDLELTEVNRSLVKRFVNDVLIAKDYDKLDDFINPHTFTEHNPRSQDGVNALRALLEQENEGVSCVDYQVLHRVLAEGDFVLSVSEGHFEGKHTSFYDLYRISSGEIVEHWDTLETIAPTSEWKNNNGKF